MGPFELNTGVGQVVTFMVNVLLAVEGQPFASKTSETPSLL